MLEKFVKRLQRKARVRAKISGTSQMPRLSVYRSNSNIYGQLIDDEKWVTLCTASDLKIKEGTKTQRAQKVWIELAKKAQELKITHIKFDKWAAKYHGRVKALADSARESGLVF